MNWTNDKLNILQNLKLSVVPEAGGRQGFLTFVGSFVP
jgi:hypothetical protein